jgi:CRP-like cAMP-binding protein
MPDFWRGLGFDWLGGLSDEESERLRRASSSKEYARGETVFAPAEQPHSVFLLERGLVRIYRLSGSGAEATLGWVRPGEVFGELEAVVEQPRESYAQAVKPSRVWRLPRGALRRVLDGEPHVALAVAAQIGARFKRIESRVEDLVLRDLRARIAHALVELAEDFGRDDGRTRHIELPLSQQDLATLVGATRQSVNACLRALAAQGLVQHRARRFTLLNPAALRRAAETRAP